MSEVKVRLDMGGLQVLRREDPHPDPPEQGEAAHLSRRRTTLATRKTNGEYAVRFIRSGRVRQCGKYALEYRDPGGADPLGGGSRPVQRPGFFSGPLRLV